MNKTKLTGIIIGFLATAFWLYYNLSIAFSEKVTGSAQVFYLVFAILFIIPLLLMFKWPRVAGWFYLSCAVFLGGAYYYLIFFGSGYSYHWLAWLIMFLGFILLPVLSGFLLLNSEKPASRI